MAPDTESAGSAQARRSASASCQDNEGKKLIGIQIHAGKTMIEGARSRRLKKLKNEKRVPGSYSASDEEVLASSSSHSI